MKLERRLQLIWSLIPLIASDVWLRAKTQEKGQKLSHSISDRQMESILEENTRIDTDERTLASTLFNQRRRSDLCSGPGGNMIKRGNQRKGHVPLLKAVKISCSESPRLQPPFALHTTPHPRHLTRQSLLATFFAKFSEECSGFFAYNSSLYSSVSSDYFQYLLSGKVRNIK